MSTGTLTSKGQLTIPKDVRDALQLKAGQTFEFRVTEDGQVWMRPRNRDAKALKGMIKPRRGLHVTLDAINATIADAYAGRGKGRA
jgi:AbrB family looped-hinge helix DNA binding protein